MKRIIEGQQKVSLTRVHPRIEVRHREYEPGRFTNDVEVDGIVLVIVAIGVSVRRKDK